MRWIRSKLRILAFSVLVLMSVAEVRSRSHGTLYASTTADALLTESRRVAMVHEAPAQHLDHIDLSEYAELGVPPDSLTAPPSRGGVSASNPPLTILVPLYNEAPSVPAFLERLLAISAHYQVEAVAVDDGSKDDTLLRVAEAPPGLIRLSHNEISLGYLSALREGVRTTTQSVIVILDAHAPINTHVMARLLDALSAPQTVAVACPVFPGAPAWHPLSARLRAWTTRALLYLSTGRTANNLAPPVCAFRRAFLERVLAQASDPSLHPYAYAAFLPGPHKIHDVDVG